MKITNNVLYQVDLDDINKDGSLVIPGGVTEIAEEFIPSNVKYSIKSIHIPNSVKKICDYAFSNLNLAELIIPDSVEEVGRFLFLESNINKIKLSNSLTYISDSMFLKTNTNRIDLPESIISIGAFAFEGCKIKADTIKLPSGLKIIDKFAFSECFIKYIEIPSSVSIIKGGAFSDCVELEEVKLNDGLIKIKEDAFNGCTSLKNIEIPDTVTEIGGQAFSSCLSLTSAKLSNNLKFLENGVFTESGLKQITIPSSVKYIYECAFENCCNLKSVELSDGLIKIDDSAFKDCTKLKEINLPNSLNDIANNAFCECISLQEINIPESVRTISKNAFFGCKNLSRLTIDNGLETIGENCFSNCGKLKIVNLPQSVKVVENNAFPLENSDFNLTYNKQTKILTHDIKNNVHLLPLEQDVFLLTNNNCPKDGISFTPFNQDNVGVVSALYDYKDKVLKDVNNLALNCLYVSMLHSLPYDDFVKFYQTADKKYFTKLFDLFLSKAEDNENLVDNCVALCKLVYNLGGFLKMQDFEIETRKGVKIQTLYMAQKVSEFLTEAIKNNLISPDNFANYFEKMEMGGFKQDFTRLFLDKLNLQKICEYSYNVNSDLISVCYNNFSAVQDRNKSNKGSQTQLKITYDMLVEYFETEPFKNETEETKPLGNVLRRFHKSQKAFDTAIRVINDNNSLSIRESIISKNLLEEELYTSIDKHINSIENNTKECVNSLIKLSNDFKYEWLKKNDYYNLVLGKLCDCCAHLEGEGIGIAIASFLHQNVQNLVIKGNNNQIVAKATIYVNPEKGYAVFNTVSINKKMNAHLDEIYKKFKLGTDAFVKQYNLENPLNPIKIVTVGMNLNKLEDQIKKHHKKSKIIYESLLYGDFSYNRSTYEGDSYACQYVVWEDANGKQK